MAVKVLSGRNVILFFRALEKKATQDASKLRFQTEHAISKEKEVESTVTKDGIYNTISPGSNTADISSLAYEDDSATIEVWRELEQMFDEEQIVEMWQVDITNVNADNLNVDPDYFQGVFTSFEMTSPAEGEIELNYSYAINGDGVRGTDTLSPEQLAAVEASIYEYESMKAGGTTGI